MHKYPAKGYILEPVFIISQMSTLCMEGCNVWLEAELTFRSFKEATQHEKQA